MCGDFFKNPEGLALARVGTNLYLWQKIGMKRLEFRNSITEYRHHKTQSKLN